MIGIILAAGRGSRMGEMTEARPKCLIPLQGKPLLEYQVAAMRMSGIRQIYIIGGYQSEKIAEWIAQSKTARSDGGDITMLRNPDWETTNMVATLASARNILDTDFILSYGDIVYRPAYVTGLLKERSDLAIAVDQRWLDLWSLRFADPYQDAETMVFDAQGMIRELGKKITVPSAVQGQYTGLLKFSGPGRKVMLTFLDDVIRGIGAPPAGFAKMYMTDFIQGLINRNVPVKAMLIENGWLEMDSGSDYELYVRLAAEGRLTKFFDESGFLTEFSRGLDAKPRADSPGAGGRRNKW